ncbi:MAG TPA: chemotaxis protein CheW [Clostridiales bacterium]|jgi:purine-binding chemotaxis protein CheW|nr:chemotaxis protein CheW [Clostridiales bacterium]
MAEDVKQFIVLRLDQELFGIDIKFIESIIVMQSITRVPKSQPYYKGVINLRGDIVPVMSLREKLGLESDDYGHSTRIIIVRPDEQAAPAGIIVDEVKEVIELEDSDIDQLAYDKTDVKSNISFGIGKYKNELINILDIPNLLLEKETNKK